MDEVLKDEFISWLLLIACGLFAGLAIEWLYAIFREWMKGGNNEIDK